MTDRPAGMQDLLRATAIVLSLAVTPAVLAADGFDRAYDWTPSKSRSSCVGDNAGQDIRATFSPAGLEITGLSGAAGWRMQQTLRGVGARDALENLPSVEPTATGSRIAYPRSGDVSEWYVNSPEGLQQWFRVERAPADPGEGSPLVLHFELGGGLSFEVDGTGRTLSAIDAHGRDTVTTNLWQVETDSGRAPYVELSLTRDAGGVVDGFDLLAQLAEEDYPVTLALATGNPKTLELRRETTPLRLGLGTGTDEPAESFAAPANDTCAGAQLIPGAGPFPYLTSTVNLLEATTAGDPANDCAFMDLYSRGVWYKFTPTQAGIYTFSTCAAGAPGTTRTDTVLAVFTLNGGACGGASSQLACDDDSCSVLDRQSTASLLLNPGTPYYVLVYSYNTTAPPAGASDVQVRVERLPPPQNDTCSNPTTLPLGVLTATNLQAANEYTLSGTACFTGLGNSSCTAAGRDTVYRFTAPTAGSYAFRVQTIDGNGSGNVVLYTTPTCPGSPGAITCSSPVVAANRNTSVAQYTAAEEVACQAMTAGQVAYLIADECVSSTVGGAYTVEAWRCAKETEANGTPATANAFAVCPMEGGSNASGDADFFSLGTPAVGTRVFAVANAVQTNDPDFDLRVTTGTDTLEFDDENNALPWGELGANVAGTRLTGVASYLRLTHHVSTRIAEPYHVFRVLQPPGGDPYGSSSSPEQRELDNETVEGAEAAGNNYYRGILTDTDDIDAFRFCAVAGDWITISTDMDPGRNNTPIDGLGLLYDGNGDLLVMQQDAASTSSSTASGAGSLSATTPFSNAEAVLWRARYTGAYYAAQSASTGVNLPGDYLLSVGVNCQSGASQSALLDTNLTAPAAVNPGDQFSYHVILTNSGTNSGLDVQFTDVLPAALQFVNLTVTGPDAATCDLLPAVGSSGTVRCKVECLRPGGAMDFQIVVQSPGCGGIGMLDNSVTTTCLTALAPGSVLSDAAATDVTCSDGNPCTLDSCHPTGGCFNPPVVTPSEIGGVRFASKTTLSWNSNAFAFTYDAVRGSVSALPVGPGHLDETCFPSISGTSISDATVPDPETGTIGFWYLVRGKNTCAPAGSWGNTSSGAPRTTATCP